MMYMYLHFLWHFLPEVMSSVSFITYIGMGNTMDLATIMECILIFNWMRGPFHHIQRMREQIIDVKLTLKRIQDYLLQDEIDVSKVLQQEKSENDYAVVIKNKSFTWGL